MRKICLIVKATRSAFSSLLLSAYKSEGSVPSSIQTKLACRPVTLLSLL